MDDEPVFFVKLDRGVVRGPDLKLDEGDVVPSHFTDELDEQLGADLVTSLIFFHRKHQDPSFVFRHPCADQKPDDAVMQISDEEPLGEGFIELVEERWAVPLGEGVVRKGDDGENIPWLYLSDFQHESRNLARDIKG